MLREALYCPSLAFGPASFAPLLADVSAVPWTVLLATSGEGPEMILSFSASWCKDRVLEALGLLAGPADNRLGMEPVVGLVRRNRRAEVIHG